ncbi:ylmG homolog protein 1-2, chloroplastic-like [Abrus precatorius]|uniref:YlmG homolog protein 1-2, chloroplastic-like n=1 Tax=Abrus precatorius TaxID=3816 RepID=A0A8B8KN37_ABRPR|nr:ylmG homolog protein 1-2, chloroplastic-like [Abrus precatorius]
MAMASLAATVGVASQTSIPTRHLVFHPFQHRRTRSSSCSVLSHRYKSESLCVRAHQSHCNVTTVIRSRQSDSDILRGCTRTVTTLLGMAVLLVKAIPVGSWLSKMNSVSVSTGALFFASLRDQPSGGLNTPLTVVAAGLGKWLDIYSGVLMVRVLLSWFPNIPWERQPLSAIRDLCDPYLNLFRNIIPPVFDTLDVSPLLAFAVLGTLGAILNSAV